MNEVNKNDQEIQIVKDFVKDGRIDDAVKTIASYLGNPTEEKYIERLENIIETLLPLHGGRTVLRFLIENLIIDIPTLLKNLSKKDSLLRYTFLLLLKTMCENECDLFLPHSEDLLNSNDPNVREAALQLLIYMAGGETDIDDEALIKTIILKLPDDKDFVVEKAIQTLKAIGRNNPTVITRILSDYAKEILNIPENEDLKKSIDSILKSIVSIDKIGEIVEEEKMERHLEKEESELLDKELELKKKELEIKKKKLELEEKEREIEEKAMQTKEEALRLKEERITKEQELGEEKEIKEKPAKVKIPKKLKKEESEIIDKELELKKKEIEIKKKKLALEEKEKALEEKEILEKEKVLKLKEELIEKEKELSQVELELKQKAIEQKEQKLKEEEIKRIKEELKKIEHNKEENEESLK